MKHLNLFRTLVLSGSFLAAAAPFANAATLSFQNGGFTTTGANNNQINVNTSAGTTTLAGWSNTGYDFVFGTQTGTPAAHSSENSGVVGNYVDLASNPGAAPGGGNYVALDGSYESPDTISQSISGFTAGTVTVTFDVYADYQTNCSNCGTKPTSEGLTVSLGSVSDSTIDLTSVPSSGWISETETFTLTGSSPSTETLKFLASGSGTPPFVLISDVNVSEPGSVTPEPNSLMLLGTGLVGIGGLVRRKFAKR